MKKIMLKVLIAFIILVATITLAEALDFETLSKTYHSGLKTCRQIEREHANMKGQHELMFKAWQEKSFPLLSEDEKLLAVCQDTILTFKRMSEKMEKIGQNKLSFEEDKQSDLITEYEKAQNMMKVIITNTKV